MKNLIKSFMGVAVVALFTVGAIHHFTPTTKDQVALLAKQQMIQSFFKDRKDYPHARIKKFDLVAWSTAMADDGVSRFYLAVYSGSFESDKGPGKLALYIDAIQKAVPAGNSKITYAPMRQNAWAHAVWLTGDHDIGDYTKTLEAYKSHVYENDVAKYVMNQSLSHF